MISALFGLTQTQLIILACCVVGGLLGVVAIVLALRRRSPKGQRVGKVRVRGGVRYTADDHTTTAGGEAVVSYNKGDIILERGKTYRVAKNGHVIPGKYTVLSADGGMTAFNLRVGGLVREYQHMSDIVLAEGEEVCSVSHRVVLR